MPSLSFFNLLFAGTMKKVLKIESYKNKELFEATV